MKESISSADATLTAGVDDDDDDTTKEAVTPRILCRLCLRPNATGDLLAAKGVPTGVCIPTTDEPFFIEVVISLLLVTSAYIPKSLIPCIVLVPIFYDLFAVYIL